MDEDNGIDEDTGSRPTPILKYPLKSKDKKIQQPDFIVSFSKTLEQGRSNLSSYRPISYRK